MNFKPHKWCKELVLYQHYGKPKQFPERICLMCAKARSEAKTYRRGYKAGWAAAKRSRT